MRIRKGQLAKAALVALVGVGMSLSAVNAQAACASHKNMEKCGGIVKAGKNGCGTSTHACAGQAKTDSSLSEWVYLPKGTCNKIVGGKVIKSSGMKMNNN